MSRYYYRCYWCGAHLDPGERCDCGEGESDQLPIYTDEDPAMEAESARDLEAWEK